MTLHIVLGEGEMPTKELTTVLNDIRKSDEAAGANNWFYVLGKAEPTATDRAMLAWMDKHRVWFGVVTSDGGSVDPIYAGAEETLETKRLAPMIVGLMKEGPEDGEEAQVLALFASDDYSSESDRWLNDVGRAVTDAGFLVKAMNDGMMEMDFSDVEPPIMDDEDEAEITEPTPIKSKTKAAAPVEDDDAEPAEAAAAPGQYTRDQLEEMALPRLKEIAADLGISLAPKSRIPTYIAAILGESSKEPGEVETEEVETEEPVPLAKPIAFNTNASGTATTYGNATSTFETVEISTPAMLIVVVNGSVVARPISTERALAMISAPLN